MRQRRGVRDFGGACRVAKLAQRACEAHPALRDTGMGAKHRVDPQTVLEMPLSVGEVPAGEV